MQKKMMLAATALAATLILGLGGFFTAAAEPLKAPAEQLIIAGKKPARFDHSVHLKMGLKCGTCHHDKDHQPLTAKAIAAMTNSSQLACMSCHSKSRPQMELQTKRDVFHARCRACHRQGYQGKNGPTNCSGCHLKRKRQPLEGC